MATNETVDGHERGSVSLSTDDLRRRFGPVTAIDGLDLSVDGPEIVGLAGPNGSGKTTLIRCLLGLLAPSSGAASVGGAAPTEFGPADRRRVGYMPQHEAVYRDLTVRENVDFFARLYGVEDRGAAVDRALEFVDLRPREDARIGELSGGMVRRTSLACAVVHDPAVLFLDEPTVGLDPELRARMWEGFRERRDAGALVLLSTHYLGEARNCDRVLFLREGRQVTFDTPEAILTETGTTDLEDAFLELLAHPERADGTDGVDAAADAATDPEDSR